MSAGARVEDVHRRLLGLRHPVSLTGIRTPVGDRLAFLAAEPDGADAIHLLTPDRPDLDVVHRIEAEPALVKWSTTGTDLWTVCVGESEADLLTLRSADDASVTATGRVTGAIEDLWVLDDDSVLLRVADPGSDRDGMHLGMRVSGGPDPRVESTPPLRRIVYARRTGDQIVTSVLDLGEWTVWDCDVRDDVVAVVASRDHRPAGYYAPTLFVADLDRSAGADQPVLRNVRELHHSETSQFACPRIAPDLSSVFVLEGLSIVSGRVLRLPLTGDGEPQHLPGLDDVTDLGVLPGGDWWFAGWDHTTVQIGTLRLDEADDVQVRRWTETATIHSNHGQPSLVPLDDDSAYAVWEEPGQPVEIVRLSLTDAGVTRVTDLNADLSDLADAVTTTAVSWSSPDGTPVDGILLRPKESGETTEPLPLVLLLHGGPTWLWSAAFAPAESNLMALPLAAAGTAVLLPHPRGSSGRGQDHARAIIGHMGTRDLADVMAGVDHLVDAGIADPDRMAVMGLSYGGYLSAVAAARTDRFRAAVVMSGVVDWIGFGHTSAIGGGYDRVYHPDGDRRTAAGRDVLVSHSPVYDEAPCPTPTLVVHGAEDRVTPLAQAEQLHGSLAAAGIPSDLVVYAGAGHELIDPDQQSDACRRVTDWLTRHGVLR